MSADFCFLQYSYNQHQFDTNVIEDFITSMGFIKFATHKVRKNYSFWLQGKILILVRPDSVQTGISGLGFISDMDLLHLHYDPVLDMYSTQGPCGLTVYFMPADQSSFLKSFDLQRGWANPLDHGGLTKIGGVVINTPDPDGSSSFFEKIGFKKTKTGKKMTSYVCSNNRVTLMFSNNDALSNVPAVIFETDNIFHSIAFCISKHQTFKEYTIPEKLAFTPELNRKIRIYNCLTDGKGKKYTIEKQLMQPVPGLNVILRERNQYIHINEELVLAHLYENI